MTTTRAYTVDDWTAAPTENVTVGDLAPGDAAYLVANSDVFTGTGPLPVRVRHIDQMPDGRRVVHVSQVTRLIGHTESTIWGIYPVTDPVRRVLLS